MSLTSDFSFCKSMLHFLGNKKIKSEGSEFHFMYMYGWDEHMCAGSYRCSDGITLASPTLCSEVSLCLVWALLKSKQRHDKAMVNEWTGCGGFRTLSRELYTSDESSVWNWLVWRDNRGGEGQNESGLWMSPTEEGTTIQQGLLTIQQLQGRHRSSRKGWAKMQT